INGTGYQCAVYDGPSTTPFAMIIKLQRDVVSVLAQTDTDPVVQNTTWTFRMVSDPAAQKITCEISGPGGTRMITGTDTAYPTGRVSLRAANSSVVYDYIVVYSL